MPASPSTLVPGIVHHLYSPTHRRGTGRPTAEEQIWRKENIVCVGGEKNQVERECNM